METLYRGTKGSIFFPTRVAAGRQREHENTVQRDQKGIPGSYTRNILLAPPQKFDTSAMPLTLSLEYITQYLVWYCFILPFFSFLSISKNTCSHVIMMPIFAYTKCMSYDLCVTNVASKCYRYFSGPKEVTKNCRKNALR